jgi:hypothetical protein
VSARGKARGINAVVGCKPMPVGARTHRSGGGEVARRRLTASAVEAVDTLVTRAPELQVGALYFYLPIRGRGGIRARRVVDRGLWLRLWLRLRCVVYRGRAPHRGCTHRRWGAHSPQPPAVRAAHLRPEPCGGTSGPAIRSYARLADPSSARPRQHYPGQSGGPSALQGLGGA